MPTTQPCHCTPTRSGATGRPAPPEQRPARSHGAARQGSARGLVTVPAGTYLLGDPFEEGYAADGERPVHGVDLPAFRIGTTAVTNAEFATFAKATGYVTTAEREGSSAVFHLDYRGDGSDVLGHMDGTPWWLGVRGACWRRPEGGTSTAATRQSHPVVHVSHDDALAYAEWTGTRLPTEAEWEAAARGGLHGARFPWGDELTPGGRWRCNIFQGDFPVVNTAEDGFTSTAPVKSYRPNGYGLYQTVGNVWEWCSDWFAADYYSQCPRMDPQGPATGSRRVMRGGSFLCHDSYCHRYRLSARSSAPPDSTSSNLGLRCAADGA